MKPAGPKEQIVPIMPTGHNRISDNTTMRSAEQVNPDMANIALARAIVDRTGTPTILKKEFVVRYGIFRALNNTEQNRTGYDSSLRLAVYEEVARQSVNVDGEYFTKVWQYLMKPSYVITAPGGMPLNQEEERQSVLGRMLGWIRGGNSGTTNNH